MGQVAVAGEAARLIDEGLAGGVGPLDVLGVFRPSVPPPKPTKAVLPPTLGEVHRVREAAGTVVRSVIVSVSVVPLYERVAW